MKNIFLKFKLKFQENYKRHGKKFIVGYILWLMLKWTLVVYLFSYFFK